LVFWCADGVSLVCILHPSIGFAASDVKPAEIGASDVPRIPLWQALHGLECLRDLIRFECSARQSVYGHQTKDRLAHHALLVLAVVWLAVLPAYALIRPEAARLCLLVGGTVHALTLTGLSVRGYQ